MQTTDLKIISGQANAPLARAIGNAIGQPPVRVAFRRHPDGEQWLQILENIRGADVFIVQPTSRPAETHLVQLFLLVDAVKRASAGRITFVIPYFGYARQDRKDRPRVPISAAVAIRDLETAAEGGGTLYRALLVDLHVAQLEAVFRCPVDHLYARPVFVEYYRKTLGLSPKDLTVVSPDIGGGKRAATFANRLSDHPPAFVYKQRDASGVSQALTLIGDVAGKDALLVDDIVDTAGTLVNAAELLKRCGARRIYACATHGVLSKNAIERIAQSAVDEFCVTDTIRQTSKQIQRAGEKMKILSVAPLIGEAIRRIHYNESVTTLFE